MIETLLENFEEYKTSEERMRIIWFLEMIFNLQYEKNGEYYFDKHEDTLLDWFQNADSKTAYAYSYLINTVRNKDIKKHREFVRKINWTKLQNLLLAEKNPNLYAWGELVDRLICSLPKKEFLLIGKQLELTIQKFTSKASLENNKYALIIYHFASLVKSFLFPNSKSSHHIRPQYILP